MAVALGKQGLKTSVLGFGCMGITAFYGAPMEQAAATDLLKAVFAAGYTHFDTAEVYRTKLGEAPTDETVFNETVVGNFLKTLPRDSFTVATKFHPSVNAEKSDAATVEAAVNASLARLGLDYIDLYYCHRMPKTVEQLKEWMEAIKGVVASGKVKHVGLSEVSAPWLRLAHAIHPITAIQMEWSLLTRNIEDTVVPTCAELGIGIVAYSPLARNLLAGAPAEAPTDWRAAQPRYAPENYARNKELSAKIGALGAAKGKSPAQLSLAWLYNRAKTLGVVVVPIPGTTKAAHAIDNLGGVGVDLSAEEMAQLEELGAAVAGARGNEGYFARSFESQAGL